jgi:H+/Cl- antiporter ClcA
MTSSIELRARRTIRSVGYLRRWLVLGIVIGIAGGLASIAFSASLDFATSVLLGGLGGYPPPAPVGEGGAPIPAGLERAWAIPLLVASGALVSGLIVTRFAPEAEGHGTDAAIAAFHHDPRGIRARVPLVKMVASAITIGSGGSGGREGPTAQIGAGFGSLLARRLDLDAREARIALAAGMAAGIGAIFRAPFGGAVLGAELMYRDDVESDALIPSFVSSIVAYTVSGAVYGFEPIFGVQAQFVYDQPTDLIWYALIGVGTGLVGLLYIATFYRTSAVFSGLAAPAWLRPAIGGLLVGLMALAAPAVLGTGYGWVQGAMDQTLLELPILLVLLLPFLKFLATSLSIGSGGSGGIFGPGMVIGGFTGAAIWRLLAEVAPGAIPVDPGPFVIVGMMALFGSVAHAPIAVMLMVAEMTGNLAMVAPAMIAVGLATLIVGNRTIYRSQIPTRAQSPAHRFRHAMPLLASLSARDAARTPRIVLDAGEPALEALRRLERAGVAGAPVVEPDGRYMGTVETVTLAGAAPGQAAGELVEPGSAAIDAVDGLDTALGQLVDLDAAWLPVVDRDRVVGTLSLQDVMTAYRGAMTDNVRRLRGIAGSDALFEIVIAPGSPLAGQTIAEIAWPARSLVVAIDRADELVHPTGQVRLEAADRLTLLAPAGVSPALRQLAGAAATNGEG